MPKIYLQPRRKTNKCQHQAQLFILLITFSDIMVRETIVHILASLQTFIISMEFPGYDTFTEVQKILLLCCRDGKLCIVSLLWSQCGYILPLSNVDFTALKLLTSESLKLYSKKTIQKVLLIAKLHDVSQVHSLPKFVQFVCAKHGLTYTFEVQNVSESQGVDDVWLFLSGHAQNSVSLTRHINLRYFFCRLS